MKNELSEKIIAYISGRANERIEKHKKEAEKLLTKTQDAEGQELIQDSLALKIQEVEEKFDPENWLTNAANKASRIHMVTHALKFTHSNAKGSSFYAPGSPEKSDECTERGFVTTASLRNPAIDVVVNAADLDVATFLQIEHQGKTLISYIEEGDLSSLECFTENKGLLMSWKEGFSQALKSCEPSSHTFSKQIYFPISDNKYHLLSPIYSSSIAQALSDRIKDSLFSEEANAAKKAKKDQKFNNTTIINYLNIAQQSFGGTKPQNISKLNSHRGGKSFLLCCAPPAWNLMSKPPLRVKSVFSYNHFSRRTYKITLELQHFLLNQVDKSNVKSVRDRRGKLINDLIDHLIHYAAEIQNLCEEGGWSDSSECKLPLSEQLWLDPYRCRSDQKFSEIREKNEWQAEIADRFANWLNKRLEHKKLTFGDVEHQEWKKLAKQELQLSTEQIKGGN